MLLQADANQHRKQLGVLGIVCRLRASKLCFRLLV